MHELSRDHGTQPLLDDRWSTNDMIILTIETDSRMILEVNIDLHQNQRIVPFPRSHAHKDRPSSRDLEKIQS